MRCRGTAGFGLFHQHRIGGCDAAEPKRRNQGRGAVAFAGIPDGHVRAAHQAFVVAAHATMVDGFQWHTQCVAVERSEPGGVLRIEHEARDAD